MNFLGNPKHLKILKQGVDSWNNWRKTNPQIKPNLKGVNLSEILPKEHIVTTIGEESKAILLLGINLKNSSLVGANLDNAVFIFSNFKGSNLMGASIKNSNLSKTNLKNSNLQNTNFKNTNVSGVFYNNSIKCVGIKISNCFGNEIFKKFIIYQQFLEKFKEKNKILYFIWLFTSDCGRSFFRWLLLTISTIFGFSFIYYFALGESYFIIPYDPSVYQFNVGLLFFFSLIKYITLGFVNIASTFGWGLFWVNLEVACSYIMLISFISLFTNDFFIKYFQE